MAKEFPNSQFTGYDISEEAINRGNAHAAEHGLINVNLIANINNALKDDGVYLMQDIAGSSHVHNNMDHPIGPFIYNLMYATV